MFINIDGDFINASLVRHIEYEYLNDSHQDRIRYYFTKTHFVDEFLLRGDAEYRFEELEKLLNVKTSKCRHENIVTIIAEDHRITDAYCQKCHVSVSVKTMQRPPKPSIDESVNKA